MVQMNSLNKDQNDEKVFQSIKGSVASVATYPMFFDGNGATIDLEDQYNGASIFLICNGPSFAKLDHSLLRQPGIMTYGMNNGPKTFRPDFWTCVDSPSRFLMSIWKDPRIKKIVPSALLNKKLFNSYTWSMTEDMVSNCPNVVGFKRNEKFKAERFLTEETFNWGNHKDHGGGRSVMLPVVRICYLLGFRNIFLLGCDFNMSETNTYHFDEQRKKGAVNCNRKTYGRLENEYFPELKPFLEEKGLKIYNCNPDSGLTCFDYVPFKEAIAKTKAPLGDIANERTYGLYDGEGEKPNMKIEPPDHKKKNLQTTVETENKPLPKIKPQPIEMPPIPSIPQTIQEKILAEDNNEVDIQSSEAEKDKIVKEDKLPEPKIIRTFVDDIEPVSQINVEEVSVPTPEESKSIIDMVENLRKTTEPVILQPTPSTIIFPSSQPPLEY